MFIVHVTASEEAYEISDNEDVQNDDDQAAKYGFEVIGYYDVNQNGLEEMMEEEGKIQYKDYEFIEENPEESIVVVD